MTPAFHSLAQFFAMGGYAFYVWLSVIVTVAIMVILVISSAYQRRYLWRVIAARQDRERRIASSKKRKQALGERE